MKHSMKMIGLLAFLARPLRRRRSTRTVSLGISGGMSLPMAISPMYDADYNSRVLQAVDHEARPAHDVS
jgi:hypothetical protein